MLSNVIFHHSRGSFLAAFSKKTSGKESRLRLELFICSPRRLYQKKDVLLYTSGVNLRPFCYLSWNFLRALKAGSRLSWLCLRKSDPTVKEFSFTVWEWILIFKNTLLLKILYLKKNASISVNFFLVLKFRLSFYRGCNFQVMLLHFLLKSFFFKGRDIIWLRLSFLVWIFFYHSSENFIFK